MKCFFGLEPIRYVDVMCNLFWKDFYAPSGRLWKIEVPRRPPKWVLYSEIFWLAAFRSQNYDFTIILLCCFWQAHKWGLIHSHLLDSVNDFEKVTDDLLMLTEDTFDEPAEVSDMQIENAVHADVIIDMAMKRLSSQSECRDDNEEVRTEIRKR